MGSYGLTLLWINLDYAIVGYFGGGGWKMS